MPDLASKRTHRFEHDLVPDPVRGAGRDQSAPAFCLNQQLLLGREHAPEPVRFLHKCSNRTNFLASLETCFFLLHLFQVVRCQIPDRLIPPPEISMFSEIGWRDEPDNQTSHYLVSVRQAVAIYLARSTSGPCGLLRYFYIDFCL